MKCPACGGPVRIASFHYEVHGDITAPVCDDGCGWVGDPTDEAPA